MARPSPQQPSCTSAALHALAEHGTLALFVPPNEGDDEVCGWLQQAWRQTEVVRVRLMVRSALALERLQRADEPAGVGKRRAPGREASRPGA